MCHTVSTVAGENGRTDHTDGADPADARPSPRETRERSRRRIVEAAEQLVRERSFAQLTVDEVMARAGIGRTLFYRHFDDLGDLLLRAAAEASGELFEAQVALERARADNSDPAESVGIATAAAVQVFHRHGPMLLAVNDAASSDDLVAEGQRAIRRRFNELIAEIIERVAANRGFEVADPAESARALNLLNISYLLDAFGREPRVSPEVAARTLSEIWVAFLSRGAPSAPSTQSAS